MTDTEARRIASRWYDGQRDPLYAFVSTGAILDSQAIVDDLQAADVWGLPPREIRELEGLVAYIAGRATRPAQPGWHERTRF